MQVRLTGKTTTRRGGALVLALIAVMAVAVLGMSYMQLARSATREQVSSVDIKRSFYLAEAGISESFGGLKLGKSGNVGTPAQPVGFGDGLFWVEATQVADGVVRIESTGMIGRGVAQLSAIAERGGKGVASLGMFSSKRIDVPAGSTIDAYDSRQGPYVPPGQGGPAQLGAVEAHSRVGSNAEVSIAGDATNPTVIGGDVTAGPLLEVELTDYVTVDGTVSAAYQTLDLPPVTSPPQTLSSGIVHSDVAPLVIAPGESGLEHLTVEANSEVVFVGPGTHVIGDLQLKKDATLTFDTTAGPVQLFFEDDLELLKDSAVFFSGNDPSEVILQVVGETNNTVKLEATGAFYGVVYAPGTDVELASSLEVFGAVVADELRFTGPVNMHFDQFLDEVAAESELPSFLSWRIEDLSTATTGGGGRDPFQRLGLDPSTLPGPAAAHADQQLVVQFIDAGGALQSYNGPESAFDWSLVVTIVSGTRDGVPMWVPGMELQLAVEAAAAPAPPPTSQEHIDLINGSLPRGDIMNGLIDASPVEDVVMLELLAVNPLNAVQTLWVLEANYPLSDTLLSDVNQGGTIVGMDLMEMLVAHSPLSPIILTEVINGGSLNPARLQTVLNAQ